MTLSVCEFPLKPIDAFKFNLLNLPYFHKKLQFDDTCEILEENGDFLVQVGYFLLISSYEF